MQSADKIINKANRSKITFPNKIFTFLHGNTESSVVHWDGKGDGVDLLLGVGKKDDSVHAFFKMSVTSKPDAFRRLFRDWDFQAELKSFFKI